MTLIDKAEALAERAIDRASERYNGCKPHFSVKDADLMAMLAATLRAAIAALPARGVGVRPLVWEESVKGRWIGTPVVKLGDLAFWVFHREDGTFMRATKDGGKQYPTLDAAKAAAQADYEARILSALEPAPAPTDAAQDDDPECTDCGGTGITYQTERRCACQPTDAAHAPFRIEDMTLADLMRDPLYEAATTPATDAAQAREAALREAAEVCAGIRQRIANGPMPEGARFDYEQAILALIGETRP